MSKKPEKTLYQRRSKVKRYSASNVISVLQIKTTRFHYTSTNMATIHKVKTPNAGKDVKW